MKAIWAFDPFQSNKELDTFGRKIIHSLFDSKDTITAVYVASNAETQLSTAYDVPAEERYSSYPKNIILNKLQKLKMNQVKIDILFNKKISLSSTIQEIVNYSAKENVDMIVIATNSKKTLPKMIFGSFCETLIHSSSCDLLTYHQKTLYKSPKNIFYAHDFSKKGDAGLERIMEYAKKWKAKITVIHIPMFEGDTTYDKFKLKTQKQADEVQKLLMTNKIAGKVIINYELKSVHKTILSAAKKSKADIVAVSAQASKLTAFLGGSVSRQVLRESKIPTLILKV